MLAFSTGSNFYGISLTGFKSTSENKYHNLKGFIVQQKRLSIDFKDVHE